MHVHRSDRLEALVEALARFVDEPLSSPFVAETIVVPSRAFGVWLGLRLAERQGIWANARFVSAEDFLDGLHAAVVGPSEGDARDDPFSREALAWSIAAALPGLLTHAAFGGVAAYLSDDTDSTKRVSLSMKLGGTFSAYLRHRPELLAAWEEGDEDRNATAAWQSELWRALVAKHGADHGARRDAALLDALRRAPPTTTQLGWPERVSVFVPDAASASFVDVLDALSKHLPVHVFTRRGEHPLGDSLGARGRDLAAALSEREGVVTHDDPSLPSRPRIVAHACHAPMRECEVLRDQLLAALADDGSLEARDVLVLCPDLETYAPVIDAVFGVSERDKSYLPYRIVDRRARRGLAVVEGFLALLDLVPSRLAATDVMDLLAREPVRTKFALEENEIDVVREWVRDSGIRWGEDETHRRDVGQPSFRENTWRFGLDRLVLGYAMGSDDRAMFQECLPYADVEGATSHALGGLAAFSEQLFLVRGALAGLAPLAAWRDRLVDALARLFSAPWQTEFQHQMVRDALDALVARAGAADFTDEVPLAVVREALAEDLDERASSLEHAPGGITFAAFTSARCVPARILVMLGMNDGDFPRAPQSDGFDLIAADPRRGDPSRRNEDRQAFLDALLSARDQLLILYVGQSITNNAARPPSVVVSELLDSLGDSSGEHAEPVVRHALHAFSPRYFGDDTDPRLFSHAEALCAGAQSMRGPRGAFPAFVERPLPAPTADRTISIDTLARFFEHPVRAFMQTRLGVSLGRDLDGLEDREPLDLDPLESWKVGTDLLERMRAAEDIRVLPPDILGSGVLPLGVVGQFAYETLVPKVSGIAALVAPHLGPKRPPPCEIDVDLGSTRVTGWLRDVGPASHVTCTFSKLQGKHHLGVWVRHVAMLASGHVRDSYLIGRSGTAPVSIHYAPVADARAILGALVDLYWRGLEAPLLFFADASVEYAKEMRATSDHPRALERARKAFESEFGMGACPYVKRAFGEGEPFDDAFEPFGAPRDRERFPAFSDLARRVCDPMLDHQEQT